MVIEIAKIISTDIRSRSNAEIIRAAIDGISEKITLDFSSVTFISRSFTDELCNIIDSCEHLEITNTSDFVKSMIDTVSKSRKTKRVFTQDNSEIKEFNDMKSLSAFLQTI